MEKEVISDIVRRVKKTGRYTETAELMANAMREQGFNTGRIQAEVRKALNQDKEYQAEIAKNTLEYKREVMELIKETEREALKAGNMLVAEAGEMSYRTDLSAWGEEGADMRTPNAVGQIVKAIQKQTRDELKNITKSTAFKGTPFETTGIYNAYRREMDMAVMKVSTGNFSYDQAVADTVKRLSKNGLRSIDYTSNGKERAYQLDTSVRMCLRTALNQLAGKIQEENMKSFDTPLVYVDSHAGARPEHAVWQGKVYAYDPNGTLQDGRKAGEVYGDFFNETDYGSVTGLMGVNCSHHWYPYREGDPIPDFKEPEPVTIDGKEYTYYEATQEMRKQEREIRATKREIEANTAFGVKDPNLRAKLNAQVQRYKSFSNDAGINPRQSALRVQYGTSKLDGYQDKALKNLLKRNKQPATPKPSKKPTTSSNPILQKISKWNVDYNKVSKHKRKLTEDEIIKRVGGGDMTKGSCSSLSLTYAGNKAGYDVLDFRDGDSRAFFSQRCNVIEFMDNAGVKYTIAENYNDYTGAISLLKTMVQDKEYILNTGKHSSVVRKTQNGFEYLELQSATDNGYKPLTKTTLDKRFACQKSHTVAGTKYKIKNLLIEIDSLYNNKDFKQLLGYINTPTSNQMKGSSGHVK